MANLVTAFQSDGSVLDLQFDPTGRYLAAADNVGSANIWDTQGSSLLHKLTHRRDVLCVRFNPASTLVATACRDGTARLWDLGTGQALDVLQPSNAPVDQIGFAEDGKTLFTYSRDATLCVWRIQQQPREYKYPETKLQPSGANLSNERTIAGVSPDFASAIVVQPDRTSFYNLRSDSLKQMVEHKGITMSCLAVCPGGGEAISGTLDGEVYRWDLENGELAQTWKAHSAQVNCAAYHPRFQKVASVSQDGTLAITTLLTGETVQVAQAPLAMNGVSFSRDGSRFLTTSFDAVAMVRDWKSQEILHQVTSGVAAIFEKTLAVFSPDGARLATSLRNSVQIWQLD